MRYRSIVFLLLSSFGLSVAAEVAEVVGETPRRDGCTHADSSKMILVRNKFFGSYQVDGIRVSRWKIREILRNAPDNEPIRLYRAGTVLQIPVCLSMYALAIALVPTRTPRLVWYSFIAGGLAVGLTGSSMRTSAIEHYNRTVCGEHGKGLSMGPGCSLQLSF
jgi:hypothetical protein